jgi:hypothetical protein
MAGPLVLARIFGQVLTLKNSEDVKGSSRSACRVNISNANVFGMSKDLGLQKLQYNTALVIFFVPVSA